MILVTINHITHCKISQIRKKGQKMHPYGYEVKDGKIIITEINTELIQLIYNKYINGISLINVAKLIKESNTCLPVIPVL